MKSSAPFHCEVRFVIMFLNAEGVTELEIHRILSNVYGASYPSLKHDLGGRRFATKEDLQSAVTEFFAK